MKTTKNYSRNLGLVLSLIRMVIGWHFLYEGISKLFTPGWTSYNFLTLSRWIFADFFQWIASTPSVLAIADILTIWGLILIGFALFFGIFTRLASVFGIVLLTLFYIANPPFPGMEFGVPAEGQYVFVNKNLIELFALCIFLVVPSKSIPGIDRLISGLRKKKSPVGESNSVKSESSVATDAQMSRRELIKDLATLPFFGAFIVGVVKKRGWVSYEEKFLKDVDAVSSATIKTFDFTSVKELKEPVPHAKIKDLELSRVILGGNLIGGWAHARDLIYVSKLVKAYFHDDKVFETFLLAEKCGVNTFLTNPVLCRVINKYWKKKIGKIQFISDCGGENLMKGAQMSIDNGADACYVHGGIADQLAAAGDFETIGKTVEFIRQNGIPAGIGGHSLETVKGCVDYGLEPDFWMKTLHHTNYWSANSETRHDNIWCTNPNETVEYMKNIKQPWIAFKTLAAGAIHPEVGFKYAFESGADFICVGMYDFQVVDDINIAMKVLNSNLKRERDWRA